MKKIKEKSQLQVYIEHHIPIKELKQVGFFQSKDPEQEYNYIKNNRDWVNIAKRVKEWFRLKSIYDYHKIGTDEWYKRKERDKTVEYEPTSEWLMTDNRFVNLISNN